MASLDDAVLATLTYSDYFDYPLSITELHRRLIGRTVTRRLLTKTLAALVRTGRLGFSGGYYHLLGRDKLVAKRRRRTSLSRRQLTRLNSLLPRLSRLPGIVGLYLTGALAVGNSPGADDYDLLVVTVPHRLWTTRFLLTLYTQALGLRRTPRDSRPTGKFCLNLYLTPTSLTLPPSRRSLYTAYELVQVKPLYDPHNLYPSLISSNSWLKDFLPNYSSPPASPPYPSPAPSPLGHLVESFLSRLQLAYMHRRITRELITPTSAFFHPRDPGSAVLNKLKY